MHAFDASHVDQTVIPSCTVLTRCGPRINGSMEDKDSDHCLRTLLLAQALQLVKSDHWTHCLAAVNIGKAVLIAGDAQGTEGTAVWERTRDSVLGSIERNWDRDVEASAAEQDVANSPSTRGGSNGGSFVTDLLGTSYSFQAPGTGDMRHGTEGWRCLETSFKALQKIMEGCGAAFQPHVTPELRRLLFRALLHPNRFVRETGYHITATLCTLCAGPQLEAFAPEVAERLQDGLSENWSQVRYAACVAVRAFMLSLGDARTAFYPMLLPHLCFNRHDVAEGVASYSQESWRLVMGSEGRAWVAKCMPQVMEFYSRCARTNNHTVREAACTCISELASKIDPDAVRPHVPAMLRTLITCLRDDSWPVRDRALLAAGQCTVAFPAECADALPELYRLLMSHLDDNIYSVREDAAIALGDVVRAYRQDALDRLLPWLREALPKAKEQPADTAHSSPSNSAPSQTTAAAASASDRPHEDRPSPRGGIALLRGVPAPVGGARRISAELPVPEDGGLFHGGPLTNRKKDTGGVDYSCGCMDYGFRRPKEPWEASDGAIYLLRELAQVAPETGPEFLPVLAEVASVTHFSHCRNLQETVWNELPAIAAGLGKRVFKRHMDALLEPMFASLASDHQLCRAAAGKCAGRLRDFVGPGIWAGHLTDDQAAAMARSPDVPAPAGAFSKVGPARPFQATGPQAGMAPTRAPWASASIPPLERPAVKPGFGAQFPGR
ncbi:hypothetical protein WJX75_007815 [Coccomyxa subellipsoidea]|uniref:ARM repeat-containing protein n=1 Tax=Coccomyxa subellipsoidea TaxID=248742 RepID=A0ABR2Z204_9CHLO